MINLEGNLTNRSFHQCGAPRVDHVVGPRTRADGGGREGGGYRLVCYIGNTDPESSTKAQD